MHDIDRTTLEFGQQEYENENFEFGQGEWESGPQGMFSEMEEMELANELLSVSNEQELEQFLGSFLSKAASAVGSAIKSPIGQAIGGVLKGVAKKALPLAGGALGGYFGGPLGAKIGSGLANAAGSALGLEAETMSGEDREVEGAKQFVKLAADTVARAAAARGGDPRAVAQAAATAAARQLAPGLLSKSGTTGTQLGTGQIGRSNQCVNQFGSGGGSGISGGIGGSGGRINQRGQNGQGGRWMRHGQKIVLYGV